MHDTEYLVKKFDNVFPVKPTVVHLVRQDGSIKEMIDYVPDYEKAKEIRATMMPEEIERQRSIL